MKVGIIGAGNVGRALAGSLTRGGQTVVVSSTDPKDADAVAAATGARAAASNQKLVEASDVVVLAVKFGAIEGLAAQHAAGQPRPGRAALVAKLRQLNRALEQAAEATRPDPLRIFDLDTSFHRSYVEAGAGLRLLALHDAIKPQAERYVRLYTSALVDEIARSVAEHEKIVEQIEAGSAEGAWRAVQRNWRNAAARLSRVIHTLGERGSW